jgi:hypothetical protein
MKLNEKTLKKYIRELILEEQNIQDMSLKDVGDKIYEIEEEIAEQYGVELGSTMADFYIEDENYNGRYEEYKKLKEREQELEELESKSQPVDNTKKDFYFDASGKRVDTGTTGRGDHGNAPGYQIRENKKVSLKSVLKEMFEQEQASSPESTENSGGRLEKAKELVEKNSILSKFAANLKEENLVDLNKDYVLLMLDSTFNHAKHSHSAVSDLPGSKFNTVDDNSLLEIMKKVVNSGPPSETENRGGTEILKWFNVDLKTSVGKDSLISPDEAKNLDPQDYDFYEPIGNKKAIPSIISQGLAVYDSKEPNATPITADTPIEEEKTYYIKQPLKVVYGPQKETSLVTLILGIVGDLGEGQKLATLFTMFPGISVPEFRNKQDYVKAGYAFIKPGTKPAEASPSSLQEGFTTARWQKIAGIIKD